MKRLLRILCTCLALLIFAAGLSGHAAADTGKPEYIALTDANETEKDAYSCIKTQLNKAAEVALKNGEDAVDLYSFIPESKKYEKYPEKFDLREYDLVTSVKKQNPWGTCWAFGSVSAAETSILSANGLTVTEYKELYGEELDLSEKHLAWFTANALPAQTDYAEGEYPYDVTQAGEGSHTVDPKFSAYNYGGNAILATSVFASGSGPINEKTAPYSDSNGKLEETGDWSLDESMRYLSEYMLTDACSLPTPASRDENGNYSYNIAGTNAIKAELVSGHAVSICYWAEHSMPEELKASLLKKNCMETGKLTEEEVDRYINVRLGLVEADEQEIKECIMLRLKLNDIAECPFDLTGLNKEQLMKVIDADSLNQPLETILNKEKKSYMSFTKDEEGDFVWAQYTDDVLTPNHMVCVVGWDDTFPASNFPEGHRPPADGAWIIKNSWGTDFGMDGFFYLSFYDKNLGGCHSFTFDHMKTSTMEILEKDFMPVEYIHSTLMEIPVFTAAVLQTETEGVPQYVSFATGNYDAEYTVSLYLLNQDAVVPTDGVLLETVTGTASYAGYHRVKIDNHIRIPLGSKLGITILQRVNTEEGLRYALVNTSSLGENYVQYKNAKDPNSQKRYTVGVINPGESFVSFGSDRWLDWKEMTDALYAEGGNFIYPQYDNFPLKVLSYTAEDVTGMHDFSLKRDVPGGTAEVCSECGYSLITLH